jgi:hypothetical protein
MSWSTRAVIAAAVLAVLFVLAVPVALFVGVILMLLGHVVGGFALFGASILAAVAAVTIASLSGVRHLRKMIAKMVSQRDYSVVSLGRGDYHFD